MCRSGGPLETVSCSCGSEKGDVSLVLPSGLCVPLSPILLPSPSSDVAHVW